MDIREIIHNVKRTMDVRGGLRHIFFVACGGSQAAIYSGKYLLDCEAKSFDIKIYNSSEFINAAPKALGPNALVICCSLKATRETVDAVKFANDKGAVTIAMTGSNNTEMARVGQYVVVYSNGDNQIYSQSNQAMSLRIAFELLHLYEDYPYYEEAMCAYEKIENLVAENKKRLLPKALDFAKRFCNDEIFYVLGQGPLYGTAYSMANCHLIEMQCRHAVLIHSGEYFHGPFETTSRELPMILLKSTGKTRALDERVQRFLDSYAERVLVLDAQETGIEERMDAHIAEYFNPVIMIPLERYFVSHLAQERGRSMDQRNYMWKFEY